MQRCYSSSNPPPSVQQTGGAQNSLTSSVSVPSVFGQQINNVVIPEPAVLTPELYGRCYGLPQPLTPNVLDKTAPSIQRRDTPAVPGETTPAEIIQQLVGRCYGPPVVLEPNPRDKEFPITPSPSPEPPDTPEPGDIIRELVGRCYPDLPPLLPPPPDVLPPDILPPVVVDPMVCWIIKDLATYVSTDTPKLEEWLPCGGGINIELPDPNCPDCFPIIVSTDTFDCENVRKLKRQGKAVPIKKKDVKRDKAANEQRRGKWWRHLETGEELFCPLGRKPETDWETCVRNTLECTFRQYYGGGWTPPAANCGTDFPKGFSLNKDEVCVENCFPERIPIYESKNGSDEHDYNVSTAMKSGYSKLPARGGSHKPSWYVLKDPITGANFGKGSNVELRWSEDTSLKVKTTDKSGNGSGDYVRSETGAQYWPKEGTGLGNGTDIQGDTQSETAIFQNFRVDFSVYPLYRRESGDTKDIDSMWTIDSWSGQLPQGGTEFTHTFMPKQNGKLGQQPITISFVVTGQDSADSAIPLFKYRSSSGIRDNFLTTNPGRPDGDGDGERATMNSADMVFDSILGYVFQRKSDGISYIGRDEQLHALHRYYNPSTKDHKYSIDPEVPDEPPQLVPGLFAYRVPTDPADDLQVVIDCEKGSAGYDNALGIYYADESGPQEGVVVVTSASTGQIYEVTLPQSKLEEYAGETFGFFLIPDGGGQNNLSVNQSISFSSSGDGFRGSGIDTAESNYCLFSDRNWNPNNKDQTKWKGERHQFWEDLIDGDDDYDDLRFWHRLAWESLDGYKYEGIQCYVYKDPAPDPVMLKLNQKGDCDPRGFKNNFRDMYIARLECGTTTPSVETWDAAWECGKCTGEYDTTMERDQTITAVNPATYRLKSFGGITGGLNSACIRFSMKMWKNGSEIFDRTMIAEDWPEIGVDIHNGDITLDPGDTLRFKITHLRTGPPNGSIGPVAALYDMGREQFDHQWTIRLVTMANQKAQSQLKSQNWNLSNLPGGLSAVGGQITGIQMQFQPSSFDAREGKDWRAGSTAGQSYQVEVDERKHQEYYTQVWNNGAQVNMPGLGQNNPGIWGQDRRTRHNNLLPTAVNGYIDTGYPEKALNTYKNEDRYGYLMQRIGGTYNELLQQHLITRFETQEDPLGNKSVLKTYSPTLFARKEKPWYDAGGSELYNAAQSFWAANGWESPNTFVQDYYLVPNAKEIDSWEKGLTLSRLAKIRVAFHFYSTKAIPFRDPQPRGFIYPEIWFCAIELVDVLQQGWGYSEGDEFDFYWPPKRDDTGSEVVYSPMEDNSTSPYFPTKKKSKRLSAYYERARFSVKRSAKEVFYQRSHDKTSPIWYLSNDNLKHRVHFRVRVSESTEGAD